MSTSAKRRKLESKLAAAEAPPEVLAAGVVEAALHNGGTARVDTAGFVVDEALTSKLGTKTFFRPPRADVLPDGFTHLLRERAPDGAPVWRLLNHVTKRQPVARNGVDLRVKACPYVYVVRPHAAQTGASQSEKGLHTTADEVGC